MEPRYAEAQLVSSFPAVIIVLGGIQEQGPVGHFYVVALTPLLTVIL